MKPYVIVTGLPASGKSTLGRAVAAALGLPMLDKDDILEALFDSLAAERFLARQRYEGHQDRFKSPTEILTSFRQQATLGPVGLGRVLEVDTEQCPELMMTTLLAAIEVAAVT